MEAKFYFDVKIEILTHKNLYYTLSKYFTCFYSVKIDNFAWNINYVF